MDTKLKKTHKLTTIIITLCILIPAFLLTALYPQIGKEVQKKEKEYHRIYNVEDDVFTWDLQYNFVNYAMEACYHIYGEMLVEAGGEHVNFAVLEYAGWTDDYYYLDEQVRYQATCENGNETTGITNSSELETEDTVALLTLGFDSRGNLSLVNFEGEDFEDMSNQILRERAQESFKQYKNNVVAYEKVYDVDIDENQLVPKNFTIKFAIDDQCDFITGYEDYYYISTESLLFEVGALWIIFIAVIMVAFMALILPFFKGLRTGWEKLFCMPFEIVFGLGMGAVGGFVGMFYAMGETCRLTEFLQFEIVGVPVSSSVQFGVLLALNFLGWAACFFLEYIVIASLRQFFSKPIYYLKHRLLILIILRWIKNKCEKLYERLKKIDLREKRNKNILLIVLLNFVIIACACSLPLLVVSIVFYFDGFVFTIWFFTIITLVIYSVFLYVFLCKWGEKLHTQYDSVLNATNQMAGGDLKIQLEEDLGVFQPIGDSLEKVQQGFQKAVVEEAKSQSMKTELITNVSHDLKTPLTAIITYVDLLKKEDITEEERKAYIDTLDKKSQRLKVLIEDLFEVSKAHSGNVQMNFMDVDVVSLMKQVKSEMADQLEASNLTFRWGLPKEKIILLLDGQRTYRVFENLLNNALKYAMPYSRVFVDIVNLDKHVKVIFRNISAEELDFDPERLTERFVRGDASRKSEGSGLGLAIAKSFVELQNGKFQIEVDGDLFKVILTWEK